MSGTSQTPIPDPTLLTTAQIQRELSNLKELLEIRICALEKAFNVHERASENSPNDINKQIVQLKELIFERFNGVQKQFDERDTRSRASEQAQKDASAAQSEAAKVAVNAALQAQKEAAAAQNEANTAAITKSEIATGKEIDGIKTLLAASGKANDERIAFINARLDRTEGKSSGFSSNLATGISIFAILISLVIGSGIFKPQNISGGNAPPLATVPLTVPAIPSLTR